jgi:hypothetical protein
MGCHPSIDELIFFKMVTAPPTSYRIVNMYHRSSLKTLFIVLSDMNPKKNTTRSQNWMMGKFTGNPYI